MDENRELKFREEMESLVTPAYTLFRNKNDDYGASWRVMRASSITDQIYIKAIRIRNIQEKGTQNILDDQYSEFIGILNYSIIGIYQLRNGYSDFVDIKTIDSINMYNSILDECLELMDAKNGDYGNIWKSMSVSSITDLIIQKIMRVKQIELPSSELKVSEGIDANYMDMCNYAIFAIWLLKNK